MGKRNIIGISLPRRIRTIPKIKPALTWIDLKIGEFIADYGDKNINYRNATSDYFEIVGALKSLYMIGAINAKEYNMFYRKLSGIDTDVRATK